MLLASRDPAEVSIQEITDAADVGFGSFYNHFHRKQDLFDAAVEEVLEEHGGILDVATADIVDPAEVFAAAVRITARLPKTQPQMAKIFQRIGFDLVAAPHGLATPGTTGSAGSRGGRPVHRRRPGRDARLRSRRTARGAAPGINQRHARRHRPGSRRTRGQPATNVRSSGGRGHPDRAQPSSTGRLAPCGQSAPGRPAVDVREPRTPQGLRRGSVRGPSQSSAAAGPARFLRRPGIGAQPPRSDVAIGRDRLDRTRD